MEGGREEGKRVGRREGGRKERREGGKEGGREEGKEGGWEGGREGRRKWEGGRKWKARSSEPQVLGKYHFSMKCDITIYTTKSLISKWQLT